MIDNETFQKKMRDKLKKWSRIIDELRAEGEQMVINDSKEFNTFRDKGIIIYNNYLEARRKLEELAKIDDATWEKHALEIESIMKRLDNLLETLLSTQ